MDPKKEKKKVHPADGESNYDVLGSYTGVPRDDEMPVQDADDL